VRDGDRVAFAAGHAAVRQRRNGLTLVRMTPDLLPCCATCTRAPWPLFKARH